MKHFFSIKTYLNFLIRNKLFTTVNIFGFAASLTFVILFGLYIQKELNIDSFHSKNDRIFLFVNDGKTSHFPAPLDADLTSRYPEIEQILRLQHNTYSYVDKQRNVRVMASVLAADSNFLSIFDFKLTAGDRTTALDIPTNALVSSSFAKKTFANDNPVGQTIELNKVNFTITGVIEDLENTAIAKSDIIIPFKALPVISGWSEMLKNYGMCNYPFIVLAKQNSNLQAKAEDITNYLKENLWLYKGGYCNELSIVPFREAYFISNLWAAGLTTNSRSFLSILSATAMLILLFAVINYINLSVAQSGFRAKEAAMRRLLGGSKMQLFANFMIESFLLCFLSVVLACILAIITEPLFNTLMGSSINIMESFTTLQITLLIAMVFILAIVCGIFPAFVISKYKPIDVVRGNLQRKTKSVYSKVLISFQYLITIVLIGCTIVMLRQTDYMTNTDLGFSRDNILQMENTMGNNIWGLRDALAKIPGVDNVSFVEGSMIDGGNNMSMKIDDETFSFQLFGGDSVLMNMMKYEVIHLTGNNADSAVYINETAWRKLGLKEGDSEFKYYNRPLAIKGVIRDFHFRDFKQAIKEAIIFPITKGRNSPNGGSPWSVLVKISGNNPYETRKQVEASYMEYNGQIPFESYFWDESIEKWYTEQKRTSDIVGVLSLLAIIISTLGMLAMSTYFIRQRTKEIAVRKVFGSTSLEVLVRLMRSFILLVFVAFVVAVPVIWYFMSDWLTEYAYHIDITWDVFALAGLVAFVVATITVLWQSVIATYSNPVNSLKD